MGVDHQELNAISSTNAEYEPLSQSMREPTPIMCLLEDLQIKKAIPSIEKTKVNCNIFDYNLEAIELPRRPKMRPITKHKHITYTSFPQIRDR